MLGRLAGRGALGRVGPLHHVFNPILVGGAFSARRVSSLHPSEIMGIMNVWHAGLVLRKAQ